MAIITSTFSTEAEFRAAFNAIPTDVVASGNSYRLLQTKTEITFASQVVISGKTTGPSNGIEIACAPGASYMDSADILTNPYAYSGTNGAAARMAVGFVSGVFAVSIPYVTFTGYQVRQAVGNAGPTIKILAGGDNVTIDRCILDGFGSSQFDYAFEVTNFNLKVRSTLIVHNSDLSYPCYLNTKTADFENVSFVRPSNFAVSRAAAKLVNGGNKFTNCLAFGFNELVEGAGSDTIISNCACNGTIVSGTNNKPNLVAADQVISPLNDFRLKTGSVLIDAGTTPSADNSRAPNGVRQQGTAADIGSWEVPNALVAPSATVTAVSVTGQNVTISGTTTGVPTSGTASVSPASVAYNSAVAAGPVAITFGSGTFTVTFTALKVGKYNIQFQVANAGYTVNGQNPTGSFDVIGATATATQDAMSGQVLRISGSVSGSPTSGQLIVPAAATNPNGAFDQTKAITITGTTYEVLITLPAGNYDAGILRVTNAAGTSLPQPGTSSVSVIGIDGNPEAPEDTGTNTPTVTSVTVSPATATGSATFSAVVAGTNSPSQGVSWTATAGTITSGGVFTAPAATSSVQNITVRATSLVDPSKSGTAAVTIAASQVVTPVPDTTLPVIAGAVSVANVVGVTTFTALLSWPAATDNIGVVGSEYSLNGGASYINAGTSLSATITLTPDTIYNVLIRAYDAAGNRSTPLSRTIVTEAYVEPPITVDPGIAGTVQYIKLPTSQLKLIRITVT